MSEQTSDYAREVRDTVVKSGLTGVAATVLAVAAFSPAGFGGMIGTSLASGFGIEPNSAAAEDPYANLPAYPAPLTNQEVSDIRGQLAATAASLEITRAATEAKIDQMRALAGQADSFRTLQPQVAHAGPVLRMTLSEPDPVEVAQQAAVEQPAVASEAVAAVTPVSYTSGGGSNEFISYRDSHLELANLLLSY